MIDYTSPLAEEYLTTGKCASLPIIDMHAHMFDDGGTHMIARRPADVVRAMDRSGVRLTLFCGHRALFGGPGFKPDDLEAQHAFPDRYRLYYPVLSPVCDPEKDLREVEAHPEYVGFKFLCDYYSVRLSDERHAPYFEYADAHRMPVLAHTWSGSQWDGPQEGEKVVSRWQKLKLICGHSFRGDLDSAVRLAGEHKNLYLELTAILSQRGHVDRFVAEGLAKQVVFGVDAPWFSYDFGIGALLDAEMTDDDRRDILSGNALALLRDADIDLPDNLK